VSPSPYPRARVERRCTLLAPDHAYRLIWRQYAALPLGYVPSPSRFCDGVSFAMLYLAVDFETALLETLVRDRFVHARRRLLPTRALSARLWATVGTVIKEHLRLLDLTGEGCTDLGAPTDAVHARNHSAGRALGRAIYRDHPDIDGFLYSSRFTGEGCFAVFDRAVWKLKLTRTGEVLEHPQLPAVLDQHQIQLNAE